MKHPLLLILIFLGFLSQSQAQYDVYTRRNFVQNKVTGETLNQLFQRHEFEGRAYAYFKFASIPNELSFELAKEKGLRFLEYIPNNIYLVSFPNTELAHNYILNESGILSSLDFENAKFSDRFINQYQGNISTSSIPISLYIYVYNDIRISDLLPSFNKLGIVNTANELFHRASITLPLNQVSLLSRFGGIKIIDLAPTQPVIDNLPGKTNHRSTIIGSGFGRNLQGDSVVIGEWDGAGVGAHVDIDSPRVTRFDPFTNNLNGQHATHVAGTMAGAGVINPYAMGMAPNAKVFSWNFNGDITAQMDSGVRFQNIMITQNSYGYGDSDDSCATRGRYDDVSHELDILVRNYPQLIHVFAAGNSQSVCGLGGYRTVFSGFQAAKNEITVGALTDQDAMSGFSSWGPVRDGRLKPEVCAVGVNVYSTQNLNLYAGGWNGTSMACPGASGTMAQLVQRYRQLNAGMNPHASLMRAIFANTADDILNVGPDFKSGFGRINGLTAVKAIEQNRYVVDSVSNGNFKMDSIFVSLGTNQLKVMLAWSDKEAAIMASKALVNDLDLYVITPINDTIRPWVLDTMNRASLAIRGIDSVNNIEQVTIDAPIQGYYKIYVKGRSIPFGPQVYAYTYERVAKAITVVFPNGGELLTPSKTYVIKWDANGVSSTCNIEYTLNNGATWSTMVSGIATSLKNYSWGAPNTATSLARIRITAGAYTDISDSNFSILPVIDTIKGVICDKQVTLKWKKIASVTGYDVMQLINGSMKSLGTTIDTFYTVRNLTNNVAYWFSIRGKYNAAYGERAYGVTFTPTSAMAPPTITLQPTFTPVCSGTLVSLKSKASGAAPIFQQWQVSADSGKTFVNIPTAIDSVFSFVANTTLNSLKIRAYFYNSCQNFQYTDTLTVLVDTVVFYTQQPQSITVCDGAPASFKALAPSISGTFYQWQYNDGVNGWLNISGATDTILNLPIVTFAQNGWRYRMNSSNKCSNSIASNIVTLNIRAPLNVTGLGATTLCYGASTSLSASSTGGLNSKYAYEWRSGGVTLKQSSSPLISVTPLVTQTYTVILTDSCTSVIDSDFVTVNVLQPLSITATSAATICKGNSVTLTASGFGGNGNFTFGWLLGSNIIAYSKSNSISVSPLTTTIYKVFVTDSCTPKNDTASITVTVRAPLSVTWKSSPDTVCIGAQTTITATGYGGDLTYTYTFIDGNTNTVLQAGLSNTFTTTINPNHNFIIRLKDSCTTLNDSVRFKIPMRSKLSMSLSKSPVTLVCNGIPVVLDVTPIGGRLKNYTYQWRESGIAAIIGTSKQLTVTPNITTCYVLTLNDGCTILSAKDSIIVYVESPDPMFSSNYNIGLDYAYFHPLRSGYKSYFWEFGDGDTTSEYQPNHRYKKSGNYTVCLKVVTFGDCDSDYCEEVQVYFNNGINNTQNKYFSCSPNPFTNEILLSFDKNLPEQITLFDALGRAMDIQTPLQELTVINTQNFASGTYLLKLVYLDEVRFVKLIKP